MENFFSKKYFIGLRWSGFTNDVHLELLFFEDKYTDRIDRREPILNSVIKDIEDYDVNPFKYEQNDEEDLKWWFFNEVPKFILNIPIDYLKTENHKIVSKYLYDEYFAIKESIAPEIGNLRKQFIFKKIKENLYANFAFIESLTLNDYIFVKKMPFIELILKMLIDYQEIIISEKFKKTGNFSDEEQDFHPHFNLHARGSSGIGAENVRRETGSIKGWCDFELYNIPTELKLQRDKDILEELIKSAKNQIIEYCSQRNENLGFIIYMDVRKQVTAELDVSDRYKVLKIGDTLHPIYVIQVRIIGGERVSPSLLNDFYNPIKKLTN